MKYASCFILTLQKIQIYISSDTDTSTTSVKRKVVLLINLLVQAVRFVAMHQYVNTSGVYQLQDMCDNML